MHYTKHNLQRSLQTYKNEIRVINRLNRLFIVLITNYRSIK